MNTRCPALSVRAKKCESRAIAKPMHYRKVTRLHQWLNMVATALLLLFVAREVRGQSALDGFDPNANDTVRVVVVQPDGKILIGGRFTSVSGVAGNYIARLNPDGTLD